MPRPTARRYLTRAIALATELEDTVSLVAHNNDLTRIGYGFLVRNRRMGAAILRLGEQLAYEGRMLLRSMIEIQANYSWIRQRKSHSRARRFVRFLPLEQLRIVEALRPSLDPAVYRARRASLIKERSATRHLFRIRTRKGKLQWAGSWADPASLESRLTKTFPSSGGAPADTFLYALYRWTSSSIHGGPQSLSETLEMTGVGLRERKQPESDPTAQFYGAFAVLMATTSGLADDTNVVAKLEPEFSRLANAVRRLHVPTTQGTA